MKITIKSFKKIKSVENDLAPMNIFIGTNNSGKSSFIQGIQFAISSCQSATRGDSNNYLRNILYYISLDKEKWINFIYSVNQIYEGINLTVNFDADVSEYILVNVKSEEVELALDSIGTGLLQTIQIFAYIEYFDPKIILLDEPDSHIHPTKQKSLSDELYRRAEENSELKVVFSTHSRYILDSLEGKANVIHFRNGDAFTGITGGKILLDIGAADADYLFAKKNLKYVIVTEDSVDNIEEKKSFLKKMLLANGFEEDEFVLHSYEGCKKVDFAKILQSFVQKQIPTAKAIVHIDRDQRIDSDTELIRLKADCDSRNLLLFLTEYQEVESYFCLPKHHSEVFGIPLEQSQSIYEGFIAELKTETLRNLSNFILRERQEFSRNKNNMQDVAIINSKAEEWYADFGTQLTPGKELLGKLKFTLKKYCIKHQIAPWKLAAV
jgi:AAA15 family ATPase/GTPase